MSVPYDATIHFEFDDTTQAHLPLWLTHPDSPKYLQATGSRIAARVGDAIDRSVTEWWIVLDCTGEKLAASFMA